ncbi:MAG: HNH endonuclease family protein [Pseudomonadota bacterium]|nr:HNH endonuclease family protein [Pseudomonadota bacterium]
MDDWSQHFPRERWEAAVYRLGNLTLLESAANRRVGNATFIEKLSAYSQSAYTLTRKIPEIAPEQWTLELLDARQQHLAKRAVHLWRADFA